jgi:SRSO17 transposase
MGFVATRNTLDLHRFLLPYQPDLTRRADDSRWPKWRRTWRSAKAYAAGLLLPGLGKSMQRLAHSVDLPEGEIKQFATESPWDYGRLQEHLVRSVPSNLRSSAGAFIVDDVGIVKQGRHSVGVYRQYSGALGKVGNCQVAVNLVYSVPGDRLNADQKTWPLGTELYVPKAWAEADDFEELREEVHLPENFHFRTKPQIALDLIDRARAVKVPHAATLGDAGYGDDGEFRKALRERNEPYVLGVAPSNLRVIPASTKVTEPSPTGKGGRPRTSRIHDRRVKRQSPSQLARTVTEWTTVSWAQGTKGTLSGLFHATKIRVVTGAKERCYATDEVCWLLLEKRSNELKAYLCWGMDDASLESLVEFAHLRWTIEQFHKESKQILGFDRFEGRTWKGWHHHITMVLLAYAFLAVQRAAGRSSHLPTIPAMAKLLLIERETEDIIRGEKLPPDQARRLAERSVRRFTGW